MEEQQIKDMFMAILADKNPGAVLNIDRYKVSNYRNKSTPSLGTMMELLYKAGKITITANEHQG